MKCDRQLSMTSNEQGYQEKNDLYGTNQNHAWLKSIQGCQKNIIKKMACVQKKKENGKYSVKKFEDSNHRSCYTDNDNVLSI